MCGLVAFLTLAAGPASAEPMLGGQLYGMGGRVTVEILLADANDTSELWLCSPGPERRIATNRDVGLVVDLGTFASGTELVFCIVNLNHGWKFFIGPGRPQPGRHSPRHRGRDRARRRRSRVRGCSGRFRS